MARQSDLKRGFSEDGQNKTHVGGQALIEGIMMRGKLNWAAAIRRPDGSIYVEEHEIASGQEKNKWMTWPIVRGCTAMVESLVLGYKALEIAAANAFDSEGNSFGSSDVVKTSTSRDERADAKPVQPAEASEAKESEDGFGKKEMALSMVLGCTLGIALFIIAPAFIANLLVGDYDTDSLAWNIVDGVFRVVVFVFYLWLIGRMSDIKRMFAYHGAEHKTIHCYEHGLELTPANARNFPRLHVRCGTAFLIMVMIIAIVVYTITPLDVLIAAWGVTDSVAKFILVIVARILLMPLIAGISYEITVKWAGQRPDNPFVKVILWPGMQLQYLTTNEPDDTQLECAIVAMQRVLDYEQRHAGGASGR